ncbi:hypothetical protein ACFV7Q_12100 [Streptomyces sp. NPDC059851]|uniref:hypothetical protein n=1 Tax=Streptomyces sp. NPDC059851 TaxID=3346971 RepID=UPI0036536FA9
MPDILERSSKTVFKGRTPVTGPTPSQEPVIASISGFEWSSEESVAYEAAIEAINGAVGAYTACIHAERGKPSPDAELIGQWRDRRGELARVRERLDPCDHERIAEVRRHYAALARQLMEGS